MDLDAIEADVALLREQTLVGREPCLRLRMARRRARPHPLQLAGERPSPGRLLLLLGGQARLLLLQPRGVVAPEGDAASAIELEDPAGDVVEEVAIVRDGDDRACVLGEEALQP